MNLVVSYENINYEENLTRCKLYEIFTYKCFLNKNFQSFMHHVYYKRDVFLRLIEVGGGENSGNKFKARRWSFGRAFPASFSMTYNIFSSDFSIKEGWL